jgi:serine/threonine protein kinase
MEEELKINSCGFTISGIVGKGAFSKVYKITDKNQEEYIFKYAASNFCNEIDILTTLISPNILHMSKLLSPIECKYIPRFALIFKQYSDLKEYFGSTQEIKIKLIRDIALGIKFLHENNILHLDIKPANVVVGDTTAKLIDFGFSRRCENGLFQSLDLNGTMNYLPPEAIEGHMAGGYLSYYTKNDIYSFGILSLVMLNGEKELTKYFTHFTKIKQNKKLLDSIIEAKQKLFFDLESSDDPNREFLSKCINVISTDRPEMTVILEDDFFTEKYFYPCEVRKGSYSKGGERNTIMEIAKMFLHQEFLGSVKTLFLAVDLYMRLPEEMIRAQITITCVVIALRMVDNKFPKVAIDKTEVEIITYLGGLLYCNPWYEKCKNIEDLKNVYINIFMNPRLYNTDYVLPLGAPGDKNITVTNFFEIL